MRDAFAAAFPAYPDLRLPVNASVGTPQQLRDRGWFIAYRVDVDEEEVVLTYFAHHRMTDDELCRIDAHGRAETIGACQLFYVADQPGAEAAYYEHNRRFYEEVDRLGLGGGAPPAATINAYLRSGGGSEAP